MTRMFAVSLMAILIIVAGVVAVMSAAPLFSPISAIPPHVMSDQKTTQAVTRFYAAANERLRTGQTAMLTDVITPDFSFHQSMFPSATGLVAFDRFLGALHATCPTCVLSIDGVSIESDTAFVIVSARARGPGKLLGLPLDGSLVTWTGHDILQIESGRVRAYRSQGSSPTGDTPLVENVLLNIPTGLAAIGIVHLSIQTGATLHHSATRSAHYVVVEDGTLSVLFANSDSGGNGSASRTGVETKVVGRGRHVLVPSGFEFVLHNDSLSHVNAWAIALRPFDGRAERDFSWPAIGGERNDRHPGVQQRVLGIAVVTTDPGGQLALAIDRVKLGQGAGIGQHEINGTEIFSIGEGEITMTAESDQATIVRWPGRDTLDHTSRDGRGEAWRSYTIMKTLDTTIVRGGEIKSVQNSGHAPVELVVILITPTDPKEFKR